MQQLKGHLSEMCAKMQARRMLREADANGDGRISKEEFIALLQEASMRDSLDQYDSRYSGARAEVTVGQ